MPDEIEIRNMTRSEVGNLSNGLHEMVEIRGFMMSIRSDCRSQYASKVYRSPLKAHGFVGSMNCLGNCWDNAVAESFFGSLDYGNVVNGGIARSAMEHNKIYCSISLCFITAGNCIHIWIIEAQINMK
jgi:hypothetical protein